MDKKYCSKCAGFLTDEDGTTSMGFEMEISGLVMSDFTRKQMGKYAPRQGDKVIYRLCWVCYLDGIFGGSKYFTGWSE